MATETAIDVVMPQMGVSVSEGTITKWLKQEGEHVESDEPLLEISTDKVDTEVPSPASGTLTKILVQEGETVDVGTKLAQLGGAGGGDAEPEAPAPAAQEPATQEAAREADAASPAETPQPAQTSPVQQPSGNGKFVSPVVARIASEHGVDPGQVVGTGRGGRVTKKDILSFIEQGGRAAAPQAEAPQAEAPEAKVEVAPPQAAAQAPPKPPAAAPQRAPAEALPGEQLE